MSYFILAGAVVGVSIPAASVALLVAGRSALTTMYNSVKPQPPPSDEKQDTDTDNIKQSPLFDFLPGLKGKLAWLDLGTFPTPISEAKLILPHNDMPVSIYLKREGLSSSLYGGNKVRTLEFLLASALEQVKEYDAKHPEGPGAVVVSSGGPGSNQLVATSVHCAALNIPFMPYPVAPEGATKDNGLNMLSVISHPGWERIGAGTGGSGVSRLFEILRDERFQILMPGGNNKLGALGHVGAILELCKQIENGELPQPDRIYLAVGSSCTLSGLVAGMALARTLGVGFLGESFETFEIHGVPISLGQYAPSVLKMAVRKVATDTLKMITELGGGVDALPELERCLEKIHLRGGYGGMYGSWTDKGLAAKAVMTSAQYTPSELPKPWVCSCFTSKAYACVLDDYRKHKLNEDSKVLFWDTKSSVQPVAQVISEGNGSIGGNGYVAVDGNGSIDNEKEPLSFDRIEKQVLPKEKKWLEKCGCGDQAALEKMLEATVVPDIKQMAKLARSAL